MQDKSCLTSLIAFYNKMIAFVHEGNAVDVTIFNKALNTVFHYIPISKLGHYGLDE